jgi:hypothetical protein
LSFIPMLFAALILRTDRRIISQLREAKANSNNSAVMLDVPAVLGSWRLNRLASAGAICPSKNDHYYLDEPAYTSFRKRRRRRIMAVLGIMIPLLLILWLWLNLT